MESQIKEALNRFINRIEMCERKTSKKKIYTIIY